MNTVTDRERWSFLDSLRGVALAGILFVNVPDLVDLGFDVPPGSDVSDREPLDYFVQTRFIPIFTVLFGMSLVFVLRAARARGRRGWLALAIRLVSLFGLGLLHALVFSGDILRAYAVSGLVLLPLVLLTPRLLQLVVGLAAMVAAYAVAGGGLFAGHRLPQHHLSRPDVRPCRRRPGGPEPGQPALAPALPSGSARVALADAHLARTVGASPPTTA